MRIIFTGDGTIIRSLTDAWSNVANDSEQNASKIFTIGQDFSEGTGWGGLQRDINKNSFWDIFHLFGE
jgi:hypothetical protein